MKTLPQSVIDWMSLDIYSKQDLTGLVDKAVQWGWYYPNNILWDCAEFVIEQRSLK